MIILRKFSDVSGIAKRVMEIAKENPDGFTIDSRTLKPLTTGICCAIKETQNSHTEEDLVNRVIPIALKQHLAIGGWYDKEGDKFYFDASRVFPKEQKEEAIKFAKENEQLAVFDLDNLEEIRTK